MLDRIDRAPLAEKLKAIVVEKYSGGPPGESEVWFFALNPRTA